MTLQHISIHTPREGGDCARSSEKGWRRYFNPHPPRGGRLAAISHHRRKNEISIHTPREGGDGQVFTEWRNDRISIHTPREGGDDILLWI